MSRDELVNLGWYLASAFAGALIAVLTELLFILEDGADIDRRLLAIAFLRSFLAAVSTAAITTQLTRQGSTPVARQVEYLRRRGVPRRDMVVVDGGAEWLVSERDRMLDEGYSDDDLALVPIDQLRQIAHRAGVELNREGEDAGIER